MAMQKWSHVARRQTSSTEEMRAPSTCATQPLAEPSLEECMGLLWPGLIQ